MTVGQIRKYLQWDEVQQEAAARYDEAHYGESLRAAEHALSICVDTVGKNHPRYAASLSSAARAHRALGADLAARPYLQEAMDLRTSLFGRVHPATATSVDDMASLLLSLGEHRAAESLYEQVVQIRRELLGTGHVDYAASLSNLAVRG